MKGDCRHRTRGGGGYFFANVKLTFATRKKKKEGFFSPHHTLTFFFLAPEIGKKGKEVLGSLAPLFLLGGLGIAEKSFAEQFD